MIDPASTPSRWSVLALLRRGAAMIAVGAACYGGGQWWSAKIAMPPVLPLDPLVERAQQAEARGESIPLKLDAKLISPWQIHPPRVETKLEFVGEGFEHVIVSPSQKFEQTYDLIVVRATRLLPAGKRWKCTFRLRSDRPRKVRFTVHEPMPPWKSAGVDETISCHAEWQTFLFEFSTVARSQQQLLNWELGGDEQPVEIDSLQLEPIEVPARQRSE